MKEAKGFSELQKNIDDSFIALNRRIDELIERVITLEKGMDRVDQRVDSHDLDLTYLKQDANYNGYDE